MNSAPSLDRRFHPDTSSECEQVALASIYHRAIERYKEAKAAGKDSGEDYARKESENVSRAERILHD